jgi:hypothetical protein
MVVLGMFAGILSMGLLFDRFKTFYDSTARGTFTLPDLLHVSYGVVVFGIVVIALAGFRAAEAIERRSGAKRA